MIKVIDYLLPDSPAFMDTVREFYDMVSEDYTIRLVRYNYKRNLFTRLFTVLTNRFLFRFSFPFSGKADCYFSMIMGMGYGGSLNKMIFKKNVSVYLFDVWPATFPFFEYFFQRMKFRNVFLSSKSATLYFNKRIALTRFHWMPEGIDVTSYFFVDYSKKDIDILQFGRKYEEVHQDIVGRNEKFSYLYQKGSDKLFSTNAGFKQALARTKVSLCFPATVTHPEKAGGISTMTARYLQSMASKCLVVGLMPDEMKELFDYMPMVEIDLDNPYEHLERILEHYESYYELIERNYRYVRSFHSWANRWQAMKEEIEEPTN